MAVPLGVSLRESPSWEGGHLCCAGAGGLPPDLPRWGFPGADRAQQIRLRIPDSSLLRRMLHHYPEARAWRLPFSALGAPPSGRIPWESRHLRALQPPLPLSPILARKTPPRHRPRHWPAPAPAAAPLLGVRNGPRSAQAARGGRARGAATCPPDGASVHPSAGGIARLWLSPTLDSCHGGNSTCQI